MLLLDLAIWAQRWLMHHVHWLWRMHRGHHGDAEITLSMLYKIAVVASPRDGHAGRRIGLGRFATPATNTCGNY